MSVENYLDNKNIKYFYINLQITEDGKKVFNLPQSYNEFEPHNIFLHNKKNTMCKYLIHETNEYNIIDVDNIEYFDKYFGHLDLLFKTPYYLSSSKRYPHIFCKITNAPCKKFESVRINNINICDLMIKKGVFSDRIEKIINSEKEIITLDYSIIKDIVANINKYEKQEIQKQKQKQRQEIIQNINENKKAEKAEKEEKRKLKLEMLEKIKEEKQKQKLEKQKLRMENMEIMNREKNRLRSEAIEKRKQEKENKKKNMLYDENFLNILLLELLPLNIIDDYPYWVNIAYCIYNTYNDKGFDIFNKISSKSDTKYNYEVCKNLYEEIKKSKTENKITLGSLVNLLKEKNKKLYNYYQSVKETFFIKKNDVEITEYIKNKYGNDYVLTGPDKNLQLYKYENGIYECLENAQQTIHKEIIMAYTDDVKKIYNNILKVKNMVNNDDINDKLNDIINYASDSHITSSCSKFYNDIYLLLKSKLHINRFEDKLNVNINLLSFGKYVYDFTINDFREATKEDFISVHCPMTKEDIEKAGTQEIKKYLLSMFPNEEQRKFTMNILSLMLSGQSKDYFNIWSAGGGNGKSKFQQIINIMLGKNQYAGQLDSSYITTGNDKPISNTVSSELMRNRYVRALFINEPDEKGQVYNCRLKTLSGGGDEINGRLLFKNSETYKPQFTVFILCNDKFPLDNPNQDCMLRRLKFNKFTQTFDDNKTGPNIQKRDPKLADDEYLKQLSIELMKLLLSNYEEAKKLLLGKSIQEPYICEQYKKEFFNNNDPITDFYNERIRLTQGKNNYVLFTDLMAQYKTFCTSNNYKCPNKSHFLQSIINIHGSNNYKKDKKIKKVNENIIKHYRNVFINMELLDIDNDIKIENLQKGTIIDIENEEGEIIGTQTV